jgi:hypothetical protein
VRSFVTSEIRLDDEEHGLDPEDPKIEATIDRLWAPLDLPLYSSFDIPRDTPAGSKRRFGISSPRPARPKKRIRTARP